MSDKPTLENVKVGDAVCIRERHGFSNELVNVITGTVEKITATQVTALGGRRFVKRKGYEVGSAGSWHRRPCLEPLTEAIIAEAKRSNEIRDAIAACTRAARILEKAKGEEAVRLASLLHEELKGRRP